MKTHTAIIFLLTLMTLAGCNQQAEGQKLDSPKEFKAFFEDNPNAQLIDIRTGDEVSRGYIAGATHIDFYKEDFKAQMLALDKSKPVMVYCAAGGRSGKAAKMLKDMGFLEVHDLDGGINSWVSEGLPLKN